MGFPDIFLDLGGSYKLLIKHLNGWVLIRTDLNSWVVCSSQLSTLSCQVKLLRYCGDECCVNTQSTLGRGSSVGESSNRLETASNLVQHGALSVITAKQDGQHQEVSQKWQFANIKIFILQFWGHFDNFCTATRASFHLNVHCAALAKGVILSFKFRGFTF